jgi:hypothetical protein
VRIEVGNAQVLHLSVIDSLELSKPLEFSASIIEQLPLLYLYLFL